jgi:hypothetical protein
MAKVPTNRIHVDRHHDLGVVAFDELIETLHTDLTRLLRDYFYSHTRVTIDMFDALADDLLDGHDLSPEERHQIKSELRSRCADWFDR